MDTRPGHQDRAYATRVKRLRERAQILDPGTRSIVQGMLDVLADMIADQEEAGK